MSGGVTTQRYDPDLGHADLSESPPIGDSDMFRDVPTAPRTDSPVAPTRHQSRTYLGLADVLG